MRPCEWGSKGSAGACWGLSAGPVRPLGKLGSRLGPPIFRGRQFCNINIKKSSLEIHK